jgi:chorismate mutase / prephenate dehydratase
MSEAPRPDPYRELRERIDRIDGELLRLLNERAQAGIAIGRLKRERNDPIHVPEREQAVLERAVRGNRGPLPAVAVRAVFQAIIGQIRALEEGADDGDGA